MQVFISVLSTMCYSSKIRLFGLFSGSCVLPERLVLSFNTYIAMGRFYFHRLLWSLGDEICALYQQDRKTTRLCAVVLGSKQVTLSYNEMGKPKRLSRASAQLSPAFGKCQIRAEWKQAAKTIRRLLVDCAAVGPGAREVRLSPPATPPRAGWASASPVCPSSTAVTTWPAPGDGLVKRGEML